MKVCTHLLFNGECEAAFKFYEKCLGGKINYTKMFGDTPMTDNLPPGWGKKIIHATFELGDQILMGADAPPTHYRKPQGFAVTIELKEPAEAEVIFKALSENAQVQMPMQETFWAFRFGSLVDQFGTPWMINCGKPM